VWLRLIRSPTIGISGFLRKGPRAYSVVLGFVGWGDVGEGSPGGNDRDRCDPAVLVAEDVERSVFDRYRAAVIEAKS
jgi:hypothetical protein